MMSGLTNGIPSCMRQEKCAKQNKQRLSQKGETMGGRKLELENIGQGASQWQELSGRPAVDVEIKLHKITYRLVLCLRNSKVAGSGRIVNE